MIKEFVTYISSKVKLTMINKQLGYEYLTLQFRPSTLVFFLTKPSIVLFENLKGDTT